MTSVQSRVDDLRSGIRAKRSDAKQAWETLKLKTLAEQQPTIELAYEGAPVTPMVVKPKERGR